jgi:hypothetical protein
MDENAEAEVPPHVIVALVSPLSLVATRSPVAGVLYPTLACEVYPDLSAVPAGLVALNTAVMMALAVLGVAPRTGAGVVLVAWLLWIAERMIADDPATDALGIFSTTRPPPVVVPGA